MKIAISFIECFAIRSISEQMKKNTALKFKEENKKTTRINK